MLKTTFGLLGSSAGTMALGLWGAHVTGAIGALTGLLVGIAMTFAVIAARAGR